jgi:hypothetical protein
MAGQLRFSEGFPFWDNLIPERTITVEELGIKNQLIGLEGALESLKADGVEKMIE